MILKSLRLVGLGFDFKVKIFSGQFSLSLSPSRPSAKVLGQSSPHLFTVVLGIKNKHLPVNSCSHLALKSLCYPAVDNSKS